MDDTVGDLLNLSGVRLIEASGITETIGFRCLGIAERIPDLEEESSVSVHVWHVPSTLLPLSVAEAERWLVDAPSGPHWMLSEREFEPAASELLNSRLKIELWGPETLSRWIGEAVLRGDLQVIIPTNSPISELEQELPDSSHSIDRVVLSPIVDLDEWLIQRGLEFVEANPVLIEARIWRVDGTLVSPEGVRETGSWRVLEDPWAGRLELHEEDEVLSNAPKLRLVDANPELWFDEDDLRVMLVGILETRRQKQEEAKTGSTVRSTMLERWAFDSSEAELEMIPTAIPAWIVDHDRGRELLHSRNGRTYEINSAVEP